MKRLRLLLLVAMLFLLTGCKATYEIKINKNLSVEETLSAYETVDYFNINYTYYDRSEAIDSLYETMKEKLPVKYAYKHNSNNTGIIATHNYKNINQYLKENNFYRQFFENVDLKEKDSIISIETTGDFYKYNQQDFERFAVDQFELKITTPLKVLKNNADKVEGNTYIWYITRMTEDKKIILQMNKGVTNATQFDVPIIIIFIVIVLVAVGYVVYKVKSSD